MKSNIFFIALCLMMSLSNCSEEKKEEDSLANHICQIAGNWNTTSMIENGYEVLGDDFSWLTMEFENNNKFVWDIGFYNGEQLLLSGNYSESNCSNIRLNFNPNDADFTNLEFDLDLNGNELKLRGWVDGERYEVKANRIN